MLRKLNIFVLVFCCQYVNAQTFILEGSICDQDTGYIMLRYFRDATKQNESDTAIIKKGKFQFSGIVTGADFAQLYTNSDNQLRYKKYSTSLFIEPGNISITLKCEGRKKIVISGSKSQKEYESLKKYTSNETNKLSQLSLSYKVLDSLLKNGLINSKDAGDKRNELDKIANPTARTRSNKELKYVKNHQNSYVSLLILYTFVGRISNDSIDLMYTSLSNNIRGSTLDYSFISYYTRYRQAISDSYPFDILKLNEIAPSFSIYNSLKNNSIGGIDFKNKVVVLDFWGLFCFPCLKANPLLEEIRKKYEREGVRIVSINNDREEDMPELVSYIKKNKFSEWVHVNINPEVTQTNDLVLKGEFNNYYGLGVPRTIVIDKYGKVVYKNYGFSPEEFQKLENVVKNAIGAADNNETN